jgi:hypothetical protein
MAAILPQIWHKKPKSRQLLVGCYDKNPLFALILAIFLAGMLIATLNSSGV